MSFLEEVYRDREDLARVLKKHKGIRRTVEELYPDSAHFIYELLQNAEDTGASTASFDLSADGLVFEHDGRPFSEADIWAITDIGEGTKSNDSEKIGRFGVGFKAVFAYSETPHIYSPTYSFKIADLVLPTAISTPSDLEGKTRFYFPFNNPKNLPSEAHAEVRAGLQELAETTLLFLVHLKSIGWRIEHQPLGEVHRQSHSEHHVEVVKRSGTETVSSHHFLRFSKPVEGIEKQRVAVAFALDYLPKATENRERQPASGLSTHSLFNANERLSTQLKIVPASPGRVAVFFPAEKETSGLRFHVHAPFVPELSRASIKDTPANIPLFGQLALLAAQSLHTIRSLDLLTGEFLGVLPNPQDTIPQRYEVIRNAIVSEMNSQPLTPTHHKSHAPARHLLQARAVLKDFLSLEDIEFLVDYDSVPPQWAIGASQKNSNIDRFLGSLAIKDWDVQKLIDLLSAKCSSTGRSLSEPPWIVYGPDEQFMAWFDRKPAEWHQALYALLYSEIHGRSDYQRSAAFSSLAGLQIVRLPSGKHTNGKCYFPSDETVTDDVLLRVDKAVYTSGKNKTQQQEAKAFLEAIGVREIGEPEQIQIILEQRYSNQAKVPDERTYLNDLKRFMALVEKEPSHASLFGKYHIYRLDSEKWGTPGSVFLDTPFLETGLTVYYHAFGDKAARSLLNAFYCQAGFPTEKFQKFAILTGAQIKLGVELVECHSNPEWDYLRSVPGERYTSPLDQDFQIRGLKGLLEKPNAPLSKLVWRTMCDLSPRILEARYQKNEANGSRCAASQLVHLLRGAAWIPQRDGTFVRPAMASRDLLPDGFPFDSGQEWLRAVRFGQELQQQAEKAAKQQAEKESAAKALGFEDGAALDRAKEFATLPPEEQMRILAESRQRKESPLPQSDPKNPARRATKLAEQAADAPERIVEKRVRSVSIGREDVKRETEQYLVQQYTNELGELFCQICQAPLPFKLDDGGYYFQKVEFLAELKRRHLHNYLCLCPNHSAMFQHANGSRNVLKNLFNQLTGDRLEIVLAQQSATIYFTGTHLADLRTIIKVDETEATGGSSA